MNRTAGSGGTELGWCSVPFGATFGPHSLFFSLRCLQAEAHSGWPERRSAAVLTTCVRARRFWRPQFIPKLCLSVSFHLFRRLLGASRHHLRFVLCGSGLLGG